MNIIAIIINTNVYSTIRVIKRFANQWMICEDSRLHPKSKASGFMPAYKSQNFKHVPYRQNGILESVEFWPHRNKYVYSKPTSYLLYLMALEKLKKLNVKRLQIIEPPESESEKLTQVLDSGKLRRNLNQNFLYLPQLYLLSLVWQHTGCFCP